VEGEAFVALEPLALVSGVIAEDRLSLPAGVARSMALRKLINS
jgi:hypothetical protein